MLFVLALQAVQIGPSSDEFSSRVLTVAVSPDGRTLLLGRWSGAVESWDLRSRTRVREFLAPSGDENGPRPEHVLFHGDTVLAAGFGVGLRQWTLAEGKPLWHVEGVLDPLALSPDGRLLAARRDFRGGLDLWSLADRKTTGALEGHKQGLTSLAFSPDGKRLYSSSRDRTTRAWDVASGKELWRLGKESTENAIGPTFPHCLAASPDGRWLAVSYHGCWELGLDLVNADDGKVAAKADLGNSDAVVFHPTKNALALQARDDHIELWDAEGRRRMSRSPGPHKGRVFAMAFTPDGQRLITAGDKSVILMWDPAGFDPVAK